MKNYFNISAPPPPSPNILQPFCTDNRGITNTSNKDKLDPVPLTFGHKLPKLEHCPDLQGMIFLRSKLSNGQNSLDFVFIFDIFFGFFHILKLRIAPNWEIKTVGGTV